MPIYEYKCEECGEARELMEKVTASRTKKCPKCECKMRRIFPSPNVHFKGPGWTPQFHGMVNGGEE